MEIEQALQPCLIHKAVFLMLENPSDQPVRKHTSKSEAANIRRDIESGLYSLSEIAARRGRTAPTIRSHLKPGEVLPKGYPRKVPLEAHDSIRERRAAGETIVSIAAHYNVSVDTIRPILRAKK